MLMYPKSSLLKILAVSVNTRNSSFIFMFIHWKLDLSNSIFGKRYQDLQKSAMNDVNSIVIKKRCWANSLRWKNNSTEFDAKDDNSMWIYKKSLFLAHLLFLITEIFNSRSRPKLYKWYNYMPENFARHKLWGWSRGMGLKYTSASRACAARCKQTDFWMPGYFIYTRVEL